MTPASQRAIDEAALAARIEDMLTDLEACRLANLALPAGKVEQAAALIRLYAALSDTGADSWLALEHAKRAANLFKTERVLGSVLPVPRPRAHLRTPTATEILARQGPEPVQTTPEHDPGKKPHARLNELEVFTRIVLRAGLLCYCCFRYRSSSAGFITWISN